MNIQRVSWNNYRHKLLPIIKKIEQRNNHLFSDEIDKALSEGRAFLFIGGDGFFVLEPIFQNEETIVNVMFAFLIGGKMLLIGTKKRLSVCLLILELKD
ncbi:hypothetical protein IHC87_18195 [Photobacterium damselae subsp. damselae]|uniref:hypothetical protein n=1 Tax=Photobacterium damselae TaxID=38293 RepID=UPI001F3A710F|nr:hypothetical protein [Photobacterium damselae]UJZ96496.1 hypothetical protein IHC87_18195 [Photobacterium damselae subsp. damselae]